MAGLMHDLHGQARIDGLLEVALGNPGLHPNDGPLRIERQHAVHGYRRMDLLQAGGARCAADEPAGLPGAADGQRVALAHGGDPQGCGDVVSGWRRRRGGPEPVPVVPSAVSRKFLVFQSSPCASMQGVVRREYRAYWQGPQRGSGAHGELPKGAPHGACGRVAPLGNGSTIPGGDAPCHRPRGTR